MGLSRGVRWLLAGAVLMAMPVGARAATLTVTPSVDGTVTGTSINCGPAVSACSHVFSDGAVVTLTASAANGYAIGSWSGACAGAGAASSCQVTMNGDQTVGANFVLIWTDGVNVRSDLLPSNKLYKEGTFEPLSNPHGPAWDAGAASQWAIASGNGYAEFTVDSGTEPGTYYMLGLSYENADTTWQDVDYALYIHGNGYAYASEPGMEIVQFLSPWAPNDRFRVAIDNGDVVYSRNGVELWRHATTPSYPLLVDTSILSYGSGPTQCRLSGNLTPYLAAEPVTWTNELGTEADGSSLRRLPSGSGHWDAGASSQRAIASGRGYVEFTAPADNVYWMAGLNHGDQNAGYWEIDYAVYMHASGYFYAMEGGDNKTRLGTWKAGDRIRVEVRSGEVLYIQNGFVRWQHAATISYPLVLDSSLLTDGAEITDAVIAGELLSGSTAGRIPVTWTSQTGTASVASLLTKQTASTGWDAGAVSTKAIASGDGIAELTVQAGNVNWMAGLSNGNTDAGYRDIDYAVYLNANGYAYVMESGNNLARIGPYQAGDKFRVEVRSGQIVYSQNFVDKYSHAATPRYPLLVDSSIATPGASLTATLQADNMVDSLENVQWTAQALTSASGNSLTKQAGAGSSWNAGAVSTRAIASGDGSVELSVTANSVYWMAGLSHGNTDASYQDIDYAVYVHANGSVYARHLGVNTWMGSYTAGDRFKVEVKGAQIVYSMNGVAKVQKDATPSYPLLVDTSISTAGATIGNVVLQGTLANSGY